MLSREGLNHCPVTQDTIVFLKKGKAGIKMGRDLSLLSALPWNKFTDYTQIAGHKLMAHHGHLSNRLSQCLKKKLWVRKQAQTSF
jgi:hypothetical protein